MEERSSNCTDGAASAPFSGAARERLKMLEYRCRRGMKELDLILLRYLRERLDPDASDERELFAEFLELPDPQIARYLIAGDEPTDPRQAALCRALRSP
jgi:antitoxin CptB